MSRTGTDGDAEVTRGRSGPVRYELVDKGGCVQGIFPSAQMAGTAASKLWPDQEQDPDHTGKGWDVQVEGCE